MQSGGDAEQGHDSYKYWRYSTYRKWYPISENLLHNLVKHNLLLQSGDILHCTEAASFRSPDCYMHNLVNRSGRFLSPDCEISILWYFTMYQICPHVKSVTLFTLNLVRTSPDCEVSPESELWRLTIWWFSLSSPESELSRLTIWWFSLSSPRYNLCESFTIWWQFHQIVRLWVVLSHNLVILLLLTKM